MPDKLRVIIQARGENTRFYKKKIRSVKYAIQIFNKVLDKDTDQIKIVPEFFHI